MCVGSSFEGAGINQELFGLAAEYRAKDVESAENQRVAMRAKADALAIGAREAGRVRQQGGQLIEEQKVAYAASGVDPTQGTPASVMADTRLMSELDAQTLSNNAFREALGFQSKADEIGRQRVVDKQRYQSKRDSTQLTYFGRLAGAAGQGFTAGLGGFGGRR